jgi:hypothetical protein
LVLAILLARFLLYKINPYAVLQKELARDKSGANIWNRSSQNAAQIATIVHGYYKTIVGSHPPEAEGTLGPYALMVKPACLSFWAQWRLLVE